MFKTKLGIGLNIWPRRQRFSGKRKMLGLLSGKRILRCFRKLGDKKKLSFKRHLDNLRIQMNLIFRT